jgi:hypothetical protein
MGVMVLQQSSRFYPQHGIATMQNRHGYRWSDLVGWVSRLPGGDPHVIALTRTIRQINRHNETHADTHRDPFCTLCAGEALAKFEGSEDDLLVLYYRNLYDINNALSTMRLRENARPNAAIA